MLVGLGSNMWVSTADGGGTCTRLICAVPVEGRRLRSLFLSGV